MKKKNLIISAMLFFSTLPMALFSSCDKDTNCYLEVKTVSASITNPISGEIVSGLPIAGAEVEVYQDGGIVYAKGFADKNGVYSTYFDAPAIVKIKAKFDDGTALLRGENTVRLKEGETITATVVLTY